MSDNNLEPSSDGKEVTEEQKNFVKDAVNKAKEFLEQNKQYQEQLKNAVSDVANDTKYLFGKSSGWWLMFISIFTASCILLALVYQGLNSWYYYQWATVLQKARYVWNIKPNWLGELIHWLLSKDSLDLPLNELIFGLTAVNTIFAGCEIGFGSIKAKNAEIGTMTHLPIHQRYRLFIFVLMWFLLCLLSTVAKMYLGTRGFDYYLGEQYFGLSLSLSLWATSERVVKLANLSKGAIDKANDRIAQQKLDIATQHSIDELNTADKAENK